MIDKIGKGILILILTAGVVLGAYLGYTRYFIELQSRTVEICVDLNDLKKIAAYEKKPLGDVLKQVKELGVTSLGVFEETLPDAAALGELDYAKGLGILALENGNAVFSRLAQKNLIQPDKTYLYIPDGKIRRRVYDEMKWALGEKAITFPGQDVLEIDAPEEELRTLGLGISEAQAKYLQSAGFRLIPRVWNDSRYNSQNIEAKLSALSGYGIIIFDGEEVLGYPEVIKPLAEALKKNNITFGYLEIIKQFGNQQLAHLMADQAVRVHSISRDELKKLTKELAIPRFARAAKERNVRLFYLRPFLPPKTGANPVDFNLDYFGQIKDSLLQAGFVLGTVETVTPLRVKDWQVLVLGVSVVIGTLFLLNYFLNIQILAMFFLLIAAGSLISFANGAGYNLQIQKALALLATITFPALAVITSFEKKIQPGFLLWDMTALVLNVVTESMIGVFLLIGLLADSRFMLGVERFGGVKLALVLPIMVVALYFILKQGEGSFADRVMAFLNKQVKLIMVLGGLFVLAALAVFVARSGNFVLPVPGLEKLFRSLLETLLAVRPRTKEFLIGYPFLFLAALCFIRNKKEWLWLLAALGTIMPISIMNSFSHIHTPVMVSMIRTVNGLALGIIIGLLVAAIANRFLEE